VEEDEGPAAVTAPRYLALTVTASPEAGEAVAALLHEAPTGGLVEEEESAGRIRLRAYLPAGPAAEERIAALRRRLAALPAFGLGTQPPTVTVEVVQAQAWASAWKAHFHAFPVGRRLWVTPTWEAPALPAGALVITLDPGMAFGSGLHPSTRLCLQLLEEHLRPGDALADIGTGSGILAIAAARLGAGSVFAVDHDPVAVEVARANAAANGVGDRVTVIRGHLLDPLTAPVDLILANLTADLLSDLAPLLPPRLRPGGRVIASGVAAPRIAEVRRAFAAAGLPIATEVADEEWRALVATTGVAEAPPGSPPREV